MNGFLLFSAKVAAACLNFSCRKAFSSLTILAHAGKPGIMDLNAAVRSSEQGPLGWEGAPAAGGQGIAPLPPKRHGENGLHRRSHCNDMIIVKG